MKTLTLFLCITFACYSHAQNYILSSGKDIPDINIGNTIKSNSPIFKIKGINSTTNEYNYEYIKPITSLVYNHKVDYLIAIVKNNVVIGFMYFLIPKPGEVNVPQSMIDGFKNKTGYKLGSSGKTYGAIINNLRFTFRRMNDPVIGGDRLIFQVKKVS